MIAGGLAAYYSALCMMIFWHANSKIVILTSQMTQIKTVNAASFFDFQFSISENIGWTFTIHRTDEPAARLLLQIHNLIGGAWKR